MRLVDTADTATINVLREGFNELSFDAHDPTVKESIAALAEAIGTVVGSIECADCRAIVGKLAVAYTQEAVRFAQEMAAEQSGNAGEPSNKHLH
jgi:hypothetical protein